MIKKDKNIIKKDREENQEGSEKSFEEKYKRARADYVNLERRIKKQQGEFLKFANSVLITKLLPLLDDLEKAAAMEKDSGVSLVLKKFKEVVKSEGVKEIKVKVGDKFDPEIMECAVAEGNEEKPKVLEVIRKGYKVREKILRPVQVRVGGKNGKNNRN